MVAREMWLRGVSTCDGGGLLVPLGESSARVDAEDRRVGRLDKHLQIVRDAGELRLACGVEKREEVVTRVDSMSISLVNSSTSSSL